ncbi:metalloregulator ArsR/SmtB family transcription factor [Thermobifida halotolerans]|uniref:Metalloregulator ArsR/SmtB family transcription factor n=2 Tax=Thermobifida halotolerans TaxID=483545 RepID=A0AA97M1D0_9ACTN|nr:metalloregulator ArsR/SmtB family transcription factor [Thermobifida halotolerans]
MLADATAQRLAAQLKLLGEPVRLRLMSLAEAAPASGVRAGELAAAFDLTQPTVSHHLKALNEAGLVACERDGNQLLYRATPAARRLLAVLRGLLGGDGGTLPDSADDLRGILDALGGAEEPRPSSPPRPSPRPLPGLLDPEDLLHRVQERLVIRFTGVFSAETVRRYLRDSYERLAASAAVTAHLPALTERFAADRLASIARREGLLHKAVPEVLFVCVHNAGRSQMAAGLLRSLAGERVVIRSAGSTPAEGVDSGVRAAMAEIGIDLAAEYPKPLTDDVVHAADIVVTMGCGDACPVYPGKRYLDWEIPEPANRSTVDVRGIRDEIERRIRTELLPELLHGAP